MGLRALGRVEEAEPLLARALANYEASYGPDHASTHAVRALMAAASVPAAAAAAAPLPKSLARALAGKTEIAKRRRRSGAWLAWLVLILLTLGGAGWAAAAWGPSMGFTAAADAVATARAALGF